MTQGVMTGGARAGGVMVGGGLAAIVVQVASVVLLSRLLGPEDFGLVAMVGVFVALGSLIRDFGMPTAALEVRELSHQQASNMFWINVAFATGAAVLLVLATPVLVALYSEPRLVGLVPALAAVILAGGVSSQIQVGLARRMQYKTLAASEIAGHAVALLTATALAMAGLGYWALVAQSLVAVLVPLSIRWVKLGWMPAWFRRGHGSARMVRSGARYGLAGFLTFLQSNADTIIIGATLGPTSLGWYNRGYQLLTAPSGRLLAPLVQVVVPTLNRARSAGDAYEPLLLRAQFAVGVGMVWLFMMTAGTADRLVPLVLGPGWEPTATVVKILALGGCVWVFSTVSYWVFVLNEQSRELLRYNLVSKPLAVVCLVVGAVFGVYGVAWGYVAAMVLSWPLNLAWLARTANLPARSFAANGVAVIAAGLVGGIAAWGASAAAVSLPALGAVAFGLVGGTVAMGTALVAMPWTRRQMAGALHLAQSMMRRTSVGR